ncbi:cation transporter [Hujiaoplasma nucleasis]|uniref:Cation transporter n=1 Tax=Hujiaoplasma nucleasis TaxID=2725268 RepID=A0A7L6MZS6_9MOLU|nr:cation diffusion facilitator family transporter [Hujiaoplasma nucleasis]QLY39490.1 cation transporter [Hujiaoplasma nucleasis]
MSKNRPMKSEKRMFLSFILNFIFTVFEFFGGLITGSIALLSDAVHDLGDSISIGVAIILEKKSKQKPDYKYTYGYYRFSLLGGLISSIILIVGSTLIIYRAIERLFNPQDLMNPELLIVFAVIGVIVNGLAAFNASKGHSINEKVISLHLLEDVFGWVALLIAALLINIFNIPIIDTILSLLFSIYIIIHVARNLKSILEVFLEKAPKSPKISQIKNSLVQIDDVVDIHHVHYWTLEGSIPIITLHVTLKSGQEDQSIIKIQREIHYKLHDLGIDHATIQIEFEGLECVGEDCSNINVENNHHHHHH